VTGDGNVIAHNGKDGVHLTDATHPDLLSNLIFDNHDGGIVADKDTQPKKPDVIHVHLDGTGAVVLASVPQGTNAIFQLYVASSCGDYPQVDKFLRTDRTPNNGGTAVLEIPRLAVGTDIVTTVTYQGEGTSPFSACSAVEPAVHK
jgi:hypothetical protein